MKPKGYILTVTVRSDVISAINMLLWPLSAYHNNTYSKLLGIGSKIPFIVIITLFISAEKTIKQ